MPRGYAASSSMCFELNVGGVVFTTTWGRLMGEDSQLKVIVTDKAVSDGQGRPFVDRDGELFKYVLAYLRDKTAPLPDDIFTLKKLRNEAMFYDLKGMVANVERKLQIQSSDTNPRVLELKEYPTQDRTGIPEVLCTPLPGVFEPLYPVFDSIPQEEYGRDATRLCAVKHAESVPQLASILHEQGGYRVIGYSNGAVLMQRNDTLTV